MAAGTVGKGERVMNEVRLLVESFDRLDSAHRNFTQGVISYERLAEYRDAALAQIDTTEAEIARLRGALEVAEKALLFYADQHLYEQGGNEQSRADDDGGEHANAAIATIWEMCPERRWPEQALPYESRTAPGRPRKEG